MYLMKKLNKENIKEKERRVIIISDNITYL